MLFLLKREKMLTTITATNPVPKCKSIIRINAKLFHKLQQKLRQEKINIGRFNKLCLPNNIFLTQQANGEKENNI